jgi:hypothetical protein
MQAVAVARNDCRLSLIGGNQPEKYDESVRTIDGIAEHLRLSGHSQDHWPM